MSQRSEYVICPICKSGISNESIIPVYSGSNKGTHPKDKIDGNSSTGQSNPEVPARPPAQRQEPVRNPQNIDRHAFGRISDEERKNLSENDFLYNVSQLVSFMSGNSFTWERIERTIYRSQNNQNGGGKYTMSNIIVMFGLAVVASLIMFDTDLYFS